MHALDAFLQQHPDLEVFEVLLPDINGQLRGKWVSRENLAKVFGGGFKLPVSTIAFDIWVPSFASEPRKIPWGRDAASLFSSAPEPREWGGRRLATE